jgi:long-chain acyl-CoA synthetase
MSATTAQWNSAYRPGALERIADRPATVGQMFLERVEQSGSAEAYRYPDGDGWTALTWDDTAQIAFRVAAGLLALGVLPQQRVAIQSNTRIEWLLADLGIVCAGAATTTVYPNSNADEVEYILADSESQIVFVEDHEQAQSIVDRLPHLPDLAKIVQFDGQLDHDFVLGWAELQRAGQRHLTRHPTAITDAMNAIDGDSLATLIYTSGTTGRPKGVRLSHDSWTYEGVALDELGLADASDVQYLWLPLAHAFGKLLSVVQFRIGFVTAVDGRMDKIVDNLAQIRPTFMAGAPRIFEKVRATVMLAASGGITGKISAWAFRVGRKTAPLRRAGAGPRGLLKLQQKLADKLVFDKIKQRMGGRVRFFISGSAGLSDEVQQWFYDAGLLVVEGYGLTETSAATFVDDPRNPHFGTVGPPAAGTDVHIAGDGEIWVRGPGVMLGYHGEPDLVGDSAAGGWLNTGDIGHLTGDGCLVVTDRKKDLIKTSGGKYVAPQKVEAAIMAACPYLSQVLVHGEQRKYIVALLTLDPEAINGWAAENRHQDSSPQQLAQLPAVAQLIERDIGRANQGLQRWETVKQFKILPEELTIAEGDVTPSMKLRRRTIEDKYRAVLDSLYRD